MKLSLLDDLHELKFFNEEQGLEFEVCLLDDYRVVELLEKLKKETIKIMEIRYKCKVVDIDD